jgi:hypothetical protein
LFLRAMSRSLIATFLIHKRGFFSCNT